MYLLNAIHPLSTQGSKSAESNAYKERKDNGKNLIDQEASRITDATRSHDRGNGDGDIYGVFF